MSHSRKVSKPVVAGVTEGSSWPRLLVIHHGFLLDYTPANLLNKIIPAVVCRIAVVIYDFVGKSDGLLLGGEGFKAAIRVIRKVTFRHELPSRFWFNAGAGG
ncbi:hypothetical protein ACK3YL_20090 [Aeromonas caviae]